MRKLEMAALLMAALLLVFPGRSHADTWSQTYGWGNSYEIAVSVQQTSDSGYVVAGFTTSVGAGGDDFFVHKLNNDGTIAWQITYGGINNEAVKSIQQTTDGGYIVAGYTNSFGTGGYDAWVLKLNSDGTVAWQKTYGGTSNDYACSIQQTTDGGYIVAGYTSSFGAGNTDGWVLKLNSDGTVAWQKTYGGIGGDTVCSIQQTTDGGYIVAGRTASFGAGNNDSWVLKLNSDGTVAWQKTYGGINPDEAESIHQTTDGGYIVAGYTLSYGAGNQDYLVLKLNSDGTIAWQKTYGGIGGDTAESIQQTSDGGYIVAGSTSSFGAGNADGWVLKLNSDGTVAWQKTYGGTNNDRAHYIKQTTDGGYILAGETNSYGAGYDDSWVLKLDDTGNISGCSLIGNSITSSVNTSFTPANSSVTTPNSSATIANTSVASTSTNATIATQCYYTPPSGGGGGTNVDTGGGCFIATAAYGSYLHPHVQILRDFRDSVLKKFSLGRALIRFYEKNSPELARIIAKSAALKAVSRAMLLPVIGIAWLLLNAPIGLGLAFAGFGTAVLALIRRRK